MSFHIRLTTFQQVRTFVALAAKQPFDVRVGHINAKHLDKFGRCSTPNVIVCGDKFRYLLK